MDFFTISYFIPASIIVLITLIVGISNLIKCNNSFKIKKTTTKDIADFILDKTKLENLMSDSKLESKLRNTVSLTQLKRVVDKNFYDFPCDSHYIFYEIFSNSMAAANNIADPRMYTNIKYYVTNDRKPVLWLYSDNFDMDVAIFIRYVSPSKFKFITFSSRTKKSAIEDNDEIIKIPFGFDSESNNTNSVDKKEELKLRLDKAIEKYNLEEADLSIPDIGDCGKLNFQLKEDATVDEIFEIIKQKSNETGYRGKIKRLIKINETEATEGKTNKVADTSTVTDACASCRRYSSSHYKKSSSSSSTSASKRTSKIKNKSANMNGASRELMRTALTPSFGYGTASAISNSLFR